MDRKTVIQFGHGYMGNFHLDAAISAARAMPSLDIVVVEPMPERREAASAKLKLANLERANHVHTFATGAEALQVWHGDRSPWAAILACDDTQHKPVLDLLKAEAPNLRAVFAEKPLTETLDQARELQPWLNGLDIVTMNTVIHFSPVFSEFQKLQGPDRVLHGAKLIGAEGAWMGDYTTYRRPLIIGVRGDVLHPMGVISDMLGLGPVELVSGKGLVGTLNPTAPNVIHDLQDSLWHGTEQRVAARLRSCYSGGTRFDDATGEEVNFRERRVIGFYRKGNAMLAAELNFDMARNGVNTDMLDIYRLESGTGPRLQHSYVAKQEDIDMGLAATDSIRDKARAYVGQSLRAALDPQNHELRRNLTTLDQAMAIQVAVDRIVPETPQLRLTQVDGPTNAARLSEARMTGTVGGIVEFGGSLAQASVAECASRLRWLTQASASIPLLRLDRGAPKHVSTELGR